MINVIKVQVGYASTHTMVQGMAEAIEWYVSSLIKTNP